VPRTYIALDLETTGLDASRDAIIEVGAVKFLDGEPVDSFSTLVNPGRPIPYEITLITGITDRDVIGMPAFDQVAGPRFEHPIAYEPEIALRVFSDQRVARSRRTGVDANDEHPMPRWRPAPRP